MNRYILTLVSILIISSGLYSQTYDRRYDPNYMWTSLSEDFSGKALDRSVWKPMSHFKRSLGFLVDSSLTIEVDNGNLALKMHGVPNYLDSIWKTTGWEPVLSNYVGGEVWTLKSFGYGVFECKAKYALKSGAWPAFWLIGGQPVPCPPGGHGSEIDIAELTCTSDFPSMMHVIHRYYPPDDCNQSKIVNKNMKSYSVSRRPKYATYKCNWTPEKIQYFIDGILKHEVINQGEEWFPAIPLNLILSQQVIQGYDLGSEITPVTPQTSYFNWVKVREYFLAPEITCPELIASEATATMDVDSLASHISWQLSPTEGFTVSEGKGKKVSIVRAPDASGPGKITFTFQMPSGEVFTAGKSFQ